MTKRLSEQARERAEAYLEGQARPLECALYAYHSGEGSAEAVLDALAVFQNADGGFGHGLEPDVTLADSSVIASTVALQRLREVKATGDHPLVRGAMSYLVSSYNPERGTWANVPPNVDDAPHAPWWAYEDSDAWWAGSWANPRAEVVGYMYEHAHLVPEDMLSSLSAVVTAALEQGADQLGMHDLLCYVRLAASAGLPDDLRTRLLRHLQPEAVRLVARDPASWDSYGLKPMQLCPSPNAPFADLVTGEIEANLDYEIERQGEDGAWAPNWSWGDAYPEAWPAAERAWKGVLTLDILEQLRSYDRST